MAIQITKKDILSLCDIFHSVKEVYYRKEKIIASDLEKGNISVDIELPILEDSVSLNTGEPIVSESKLTSSRGFGISVRRGDSDITMKVASIHGEINEYLLNKQNDIDNETILGKSFNLEPKTIEGSLFLFSENHNTIIVLANVSITSNLVIEQDSTSYFLLRIVPYSNADNDEIYILRKDKNTYIVDNNDNRLISKQNEFIVTDRNE